MKFIDDIKLILGEELKKSGRSFYSNKQTLQKGKYLVIGLNPGGDPEIIKNTIEDSFKQIEDVNFNAYYENWLTNGKIHRLQKNLRYLFAELGTDLRMVCATNLFYERTKRESDLSNVNTDLYKKILFLTLELISPEIIFVFGNKSTNTLLAVMQIDESSNRQIESEHGTWKICFIESKFKDKKVKIVSFPHLSIYTLYNRPNIIDNIKKFTASP
jgi:hypothetical protein